MTNLATVQKWLTSIIVKPGNLDVKIHLADRHYRLDNEQLVCATDSMTAANKIGIYARGYLLRLLECLEAEFPVLRHLLGEELFSTFANAYLSQMPSSSPDLYDLGKFFPAFLEAAQPPAGSKNTGTATQFDLPFELARLERALAVAARSRGTEGQPEHQHTDPILELFGGAQYQTAPCLQLLRQPYDLPPFVRTVQRQTDAASPERKETFVAISRKNYRLTMQTLNPWQWYFLQALQSTPDFMVAVEKSAAKCEIEKDSLLADLVLWLPVGESLGLVFKCSKV